MTLSQIKAECVRIAAIMGPKGHCCFYVSNEDYSPGHVGVGLHVAATEYIRGRTLEGMFHDARARARALVAERDAAARAGDAEYESWLEPPLPLAVAAE